MLLESMDIFAIGMAIIGALFIIILVVAFKTKPTKEEMEAEENKRLGAKGEVFETHAEVVDMACDVVSVGYHAYKLPKAERNFFVKFRYDNGEIHDFKVDESYYDAFEVGQKGELTLLDGRIDSFVLD